VGTPGGGQIKGFSKIFFVRPKRSGGPGGGLYIKKAGGVFKNTPRGWVGALKKAGQKRGALLLREETTKLFGGPESGH